MEEVGEVFPNLYVYRGKKSIFFIFLFFFCVYRSLGTGKPHPRRLKSNFSWMYECLQVAFWINWGGPFYEPRHKSKGTNCANLPRKTLHRRCTYRVGGFVQAILAYEVPFEYASVADHVTISRKTCLNLSIVFLIINLWDHGKYNHGTIGAPLP